MKANISAIAVTLMLSLLRVTAEPPPDAAAYAREIFASHGARRNCCAS